MKKLGSLLIASLFLVSLSTCAIPGTIEAALGKNRTVFFTDSDEILINPGKGWVLYPPFWPNLKSDAVWEYAATGYSRYTWAEIQPDGPDTYDWSKLEGHLSACKAKGKKFAFGIMPADSNYQDSGIPQWLYDRGAQYYVGTNGQVYPVWDDPVFLQYQKRLVDKLAELFDGHEDISWIDARNYGNWGEWHLSGIGGVEADEATQRKMLEMWTVFQETDIVVPGNSEHYHTQYATQTLELGIRCDSSDYWHAAGELAKDIAPSVSEWSTRYSSLKTGSGWTGLVWDDQWIPDYMAKSGYSYDNLGQYDWDSDVFLAEKTDLVKTWANRMGYWFRLTCATYPLHWVANHPEALAFEVRNDGVAPIFVHKKNSVLKLALLDENHKVIGNPVLLEHIHPFDWKPGTTTQCQDIAAFPDVTKGRFLALGLFSKAEAAQPDIRFGTCGVTDEGWLVLGGIQ